MRFPRPPTAGSSRRFRRWRPSGRAFWSPTWGCGSGVFTERPSALGCRCVGLDLSEGLAQRGRQHVADVPFVVGDVERLPFPSGCFDAVPLSGVVHHLPDPVDCARETFRILKRGGVFVAFDPNRRNPFMYLYLDRSSPFYSQTGVTENERPVISSEVARIFGDAGFSVKTDFLSVLHYRYIASGTPRWALPVKMPSSKPSSGPGS